MALIKRSPECLPEQIAGFSGNPTYTMEPISYHESEEENFEPGIQQEAIFIPMRNEHESNFNHQMVSLHLMHKSRPSIVAWLNSSLSVSHMKCYLKVVYYQLLLFQLLSDSSDSDREHESGNEIVSTTDGLRAFPISSDHEDDEVPVSFVFSHWIMHKSLDIDNDIFLIISFFLVVWPVRGNMWIRG